MKRKMIVLKNWEEIAGGLKRRMEQRKEALKKYEALKLKEEKELKGIFRKTNCVKTNSGVTFGEFRKF